MQYVALLRAINVGGRVVKMDALRRLFASMGLSGVETFIASGNVIFESPARSATRLEAEIETALERTLGYAVATFIRAMPDIADLARHPLVSGQQAPDGASLYVAFLRAAPSKVFVRKLTAFNNEVDELQVCGREVLWMVRGKFLDSTFSAAQLEKTLAGPATVRSASTIRRLAAKYAR